MYIMDVCTCEHTTDKLIPKYDGEMCQIQIS